MASRSGSSARAGTWYGNAGGLDLGLGPDDPLGQRGRRQEERAGDLFGGEAADFAQGEGDLRVGRQGRVTAGEDEAEPVVLDLFVVHLVRRGDAVAQTIGYHSERGVEPGSAAEPVYGLEAAGRDQPGPGILGNPVRRPTLHRRREGVLKRLLGQIEVAEETDQGGEDAAGFGAEEVFDRSAGHGRRV